MTKWFIVESPSKIKSIGNILREFIKDKFLVIATGGHITKLSNINREHLEPEWEFLPNKTRLIKQIEKIKDNDEIYLTTDPDREGEAIAFHVFNLIKSYSKKVLYYRISTNEITRDGIMRALDEKEKEIDSIIDKNLLNAYLTRTILDYLIGFDLSPLLWSRLVGCKSVGRVQTVALDILTERQLLISSFFKEKIYYLNGKLDYSIAKSESYKDIKILNNFSTVKNIETSEEISYVNPYLPFDTASLQISCFNLFGYSVEKTMNFCQKLYEGIKFKDNNYYSLISYHRTNSNSMSKEFIEKAYKYLEITLLIPPVIKRKIGYISKFSKEAHEAIRPTRIDLDINYIKDNIDRSIFNVYKLIYERSLGYLLDPITLKIKNINIYLDNSIILNSKEKKIIYKNNRFFNPKIIGLVDEYSNINNFTINNISLEESFTKPVENFSEGSLVKEMKSLGIGRPSTYGYIINVLKNRLYSYSKKSKIFPNSRCRVLSIFMKRFFPFIIDRNFTKKMEEQLEMIANGKENYKEVINSFYNNIKLHIKELMPFSKKEILTDIERIIEENIGKCNKCKSNLKLRFTKKNQEAFMMCYNYPNCLSFFNLYKISDDSKILPSNM